MARNEVFADTSALFAFVDRRDAHHERSRARLKMLFDAGQRLVTTDYVVAETLNLASARRGKLVAERVMELMERSSGIRLEWIGPDRFDTTKTFFRKHADHGYSFTDCTSFVVMKELGLKDALTTDRHFTEAGFKVLLPAAP